MSNLKTLALFEIFENFNANNSNGDGERLNNVEVTALINSIEALYARQSYIGKVKEFMLTFKQPMPRTPEVSAIIQLRLTLLLEELAELAEASGAVGAIAWKTLLQVHTKRAAEFKPEVKPDLVMVFDALHDLQYVLSGAVLSFGMEHKFDEGFDEVHASNMSKVCMTIEEAQATVDASVKGGIPARIEPYNGFLLVLRESDNKVIKSINYHPANLAPILFPELTKEKGE